jgi:hypothetical protein
MLRGCESRGEQVTLTYTESQVRTMLAIATRTIPECDALAAQTGEHPWDLKLMAKGKTPVTGKVLAFLELRPKGRRYLWVI